MKTTQEQFDEFCDKLADSLQNALDAYNSFFLSEDNVKEFQKYLGNIQVLNGDKTDS